MICVDCALLSIVIVQGWSVKQCITFNYYYFKYVYNMSIL